MEIVARLLHHAAIANRTDLTLVGSRGSAVQQRDLDDAGLGCR